MTSTIAPVQPAEAQLTAYTDGKRASARRRRQRAVVHALLVYGLLTIATICFFLPFLWMVLAAFKPTQDIVSTQPFSITRFSLENFRALLKLAPVGTYFKNSLIYSVGSTIGTVFSATLVGYGFARIEVRGSRIWFVLAMSTLMIPFMVTLFPQYSFYLKLHLLNSFAPLILPAFLGVGGTTLFIFLMRQFFLGLPKDLEDAAYVDGCSRFRAFVSVMLPLARPAMMTVIIFQFVFSWNDLFGPLVYLTSSSKYTIPLGVATFSGAYGTDVGPLIAFTLLSVIPLVVIFVVFQRYFVKTLATAGLRG